MPQVPKSIEEWHNTEKASFPDFAKGGTGHYLLEAGIQVQEVLQFDPNRWRTRGSNKAVSRASLELILTAPDSNQDVHDNNNGIACMLTVRSHGSFTVTASREILEFFGNCGVDGNPGIATLGIRVTPHTLGRKRRSVVYGATPGFEFMLYNGTITAYKERRQS